MCVGLPVLGLVASIGQQVVAYQGAKADYKASEAAYETNLQNSKTALYDRFDALNNRMAQEEAAASNDAQEASIEGLRARSSARVAASEGGVSGVSVDSIIKDMFSRQSRYIVNTEKNLDFTRRYIAGEGRSAAAQAQGQVNSVRRMAKPSFLPYAMNIFGSAVSAAGDMKMPGAKQPHLLYG